MRIKAKDPKLVSLIGEFMKVYLPCVRNRDDDTIVSYRFSIKLYIAYLEAVKGLTILTIRSCDFNQKNIVAFMSWLRSDRHNVATTINHRLSDVRGFCRYLFKKKAIISDEYEEIREISDVSDDRVIDFA